MIKEVTLPQVSDRHASRWIEWEKVADREKEKERKKKEKNEEEKCTLGNNNNRGRRHTGTEIRSCRRSTPANSARASLPHV